MRTGDWHFFEVENVTEISKSANIYSVNVLANWTAVCQKVTFTYLCVCVCVCVCVFVCVYFIQGQLHNFWIWTWHKMNMQGLLFKKQDKSDTENTKTDFFPPQFPSYYLLFNTILHKENFKLSA